jgi:peptidoglycan/LPS O-acetylase OafA/YrhL
MRASALSFQAAVAFVVVGMIWGIIMAISEDHSAMPAHAHLNLLGWVSLFLFGIYYRLHPSLEGAKIASVQVWVWIVGTIMLVTGVGLVHTGHPVGDPMAAIGSFVVLFGMLLFGWLVFRGERAVAVSRPLAKSAL